MLNRHKAGPTCASNVGKRNIRTVVVHLLHRWPGCPRAHRLRASLKNGPHITCVFSTLSCRQYIGEAGKMSSKELNLVYLHNDEAKSMRRWTHEKMEARYSNSRIVYHVRIPNHLAQSLIYTHLIGSKLSLPASVIENASAYWLSPPRLVQVHVDPLAMPSETSILAVGVKCVSVGVVEVVRMSHGVVVWTVVPGAHPLVVGTLAVPRARLPGGQAGAASVDLDAVVIVRAPTAENALPRADAKSWTGLLVRAQDLGSCQVTDCDLGHSPGTTR